MAKGIAINGMLRGKLGGVVYSRVNGEQISRVKAEVVKNPKTSAQMAQRAIFATATQAYSLMKPIVDHSREGIQYGAKTQQAFMKDALALLRARAAADDGNFLIPNVAALMANPYVISKGSLTSPKHIAYNDSNSSIDITNMSNPTIDKHSVVTAKSFCDALDINKGDQVTLVAIVRDADQPVLGEYAGREYRRNKFLYARITVKADVSDDQVVINGANNSWGDAVIVEGLNGDTFEVTGVQANVMTIELQEEILAFACIRSAKIDGKWLRSTQSLILADDQLLYNFNDILPAWKAGSTTLEFDSTRYLNNAETEEVVSTPTLTKVAARCTNAGETVIQECAALSKGGYAGSPIVDSGDTKHPYELKANGHVRLYNNDVVLDGYITKEFAEKQLGTTIIVDQQWRGKTNTNSAEYELQQETGVDDYVIHITGYQGPGSFEMPALLVAIGTDEKAHFVVNNGQAIADDGTPAEYGVAYGTGSMNYQTLDAWRLSELKNYCRVVGNDSGTEFAIGDEITLETYNRITQEFEKLGYVW